MKPISTNAISTENALKRATVVLYENNSIQLLAMVREIGKGKVELLNEQASIMSLPADRLYCTSISVADDLKSDKERAAFLVNTKKQAYQIEQQIDLEEIWRSLLGETESIDTKGLTELYFGKVGALELLAMRLKLLTDKTFFKRRAEIFQPREQETVEQLKRAELAEAKRLELQQLCINEIKARVIDKTAPLSSSVQSELTLLEDLVVGKLEGLRMKEAREFLDQLLEQLDFVPSGNPEERAYKLLERLGVFKRSTNLALIKFRPAIEFSAELEELGSKLAPPDWNQRKDLTNLFTFTVDDESTKDMDDALSLDQTEDGFELGIHISDVASLIEQGSLIDLDAKKRATSLYCPERTIHMFPDSLSKRLLSLVEGEKRAAISYIFKLSHDFKVLSHQIFASSIQIKARLSYNQVDQILEEKSSSKNEIAYKLDIIYQAAVRLEEERMHQGALKVNKRDVSVAFEPDGSLSLFEIDENSPARSTIGEMAILANRISSEFAIERNLPFLYRGQPERNEEDANSRENHSSSAAQDYQVRVSLKKSNTSTIPQAHSGLGLKSYCQVTSPIRRYADLACQRQLLSALNNTQAPYSAKQLEELNFELADALNAAKLISRESKRYWLLVYLKEQLGRGAELGATVLRTDLRYPLLELDLVYINQSCQLKKPRKIGERVLVRIVDINPPFDLLRLEEIAR
jgi:exoribonuclease-2